MNDHTKLLRQVHPSFIQNGSVTSQAFRPTPKDDEKLSFYDGDQIDPKTSYDHFTSNPNCKSSGVLAVTVSECAAQSLSAEPDPEAFAEHVLVDYSGLSKKQIEKTAKILRSKAVARDWLYQA